MRIRNHEYYAEMVQKAVDVGLGIRAQVYEVVETVKCGKISREEGKKLMYRRLCALERIAKVQARAYKIAYGVDAPTIPELK